MGNRGVKRYSKSGRRGATPPVWAAVAAAAVLCGGVAAQAQTRTAQGGETVAAEPVCATPPAAWFSDVEAAAWARLCADGRVDMSTLVLQADPAQPALRADPARCDPVDDPIWSAERRLSAAFLETVLFEPSFGAALPRPAIVVRCAQIVGALDAAGRRLAVAATVEDSRIEGGVALRGARLAAPVALLGVRIRGALSLDDAVVAHTLYLRRVAALGAASMNGLRGDGGLEAQDSVFAAGVSAERATLSGALRLDGARVEGGVAVTGARFDDGFSLAGAVVSGDVSAARLRLGGPLSLRNGDVGGAVDLSGATLNGGVAAAGGVFRGRVDFRDASVEHAARLDRAEFQGALTFAAARVAGTAAFRAAQIDGVLNFTGAEVERLDFGGASGVGRAAFGPEATLVFAGLRVARLDGIEITGRLSSTVPQVRSLRGARIAGGDFYAAPAADVAAWLNRGLGPTSHDAALYALAAQAAGRAGRHAAAQALLEEERARYRRTQATGWEAAGLAAAEWIAGYGYAPERAAAWWAALVALGAVGAAANPRLARRGGVTLFRLSAENATPWPLFSADRDALYRAGPWTAAGFTAQRAAAAVLLTTTLMLSIGAAL